jgi:hypothetical protein
MAGWEKYIATERVEPGVIKVTIQTSAYPMVGDHWRQQLTGANAKKWGRIYIDPDPTAKQQRRSIALGPFKGLYRGEVGNNNDECPGAMFIWETRDTAHVQPCDAKSNQDFGRDLYRALENRVLKETVSGPPKPIQERMAWWEVRFEFC